MKILILTGRFGLGHYSVSETIRQELNITCPGAEVSVVDVLDYMLPSFSDTVYKGFELLVSKYAGLYNTLNRCSDCSAKVPFKSRIAKQAAKLIDNYSPDIIVSTLPICSQWISIYKLAFKSEIPLYTYVTDVTVHGEWIVPGTDRYFVGAEETKLTLMQSGVPEDSIHICGIPVKRIFSTEEKLASSPVPEILVMGGGLGIIPVDIDTLNWLSRCKSVHVTIITGKNKSLYQKLTALFPSFEIIGYTANVPYYIKRADLLVTKPGGITTFEAISSRTPLYIVNPYLTQEIGNAEYIEKNYLGRVIWDKLPSNAVAADIAALVADRDAICEMKRQMNSIAKSFDAICPETEYSVKGAA